MSEKTTQDPSAVVFRGFGGIDTHASHQGPAAASDVLNFRIGSDGSLQKRCGYRLLTDLGSPIRAFLRGQEEGKTVLYLLAENTVYALYPESGELRSLGTVSCGSGNACFFYLDGTLYLSDSTDFYSLASGTPTSVTGYVPLVGKDWRNDEVGEIWEPRNLLNRHARISYLIGDPASIFLCTKYPVESVEAVYVNGTLADPDRYEIDHQFCTVNVRELNTGDRVTVHLTYQSGNDALLADFCTVTHSILFGNAENSRLFFWGGVQDCTVFCSAHVNRDSLAESRLHYPESDGLYLPEGFEFRVGEGRYPVRGAVCHHDRLLLFTEGDAWMARADVSGLSEFPTVCIHAQVGCAADNGTVLAGNLPITLGRHTVWQWAEESQEESRYRAERLSAAVDERFGKEELSHATVFYHRAEEEIWIGDREEGRVWICRPPSACWYRFDGIFADGFFDADGQIGFWKSGKVYLFDPSLKRDRNGESAEGEAIEAIYQSGILDFETDQKKNIASLTLRGDPDGEPLSFTVSGNGTKDAVCTLRRSVPDAHGVYRLRFPGGRFTCATLTVRSSGNARPVLHQLTLRRR